MELTEDLTGLLLCLFAKKYMCGRIWFGLTHNLVKTTGGTILEPSPILLLDTIPEYPQYQKEPNKLNNQMVLS